MKKQKPFLLYLNEKDHKQIKIRASHLAISMNKYIYEAICDRWEKESHLGFPKIEIANEKDMPVL